MPKFFKLAILRARHDPAYQQISDQACIDMIMTGRQSALRYWSETTHGYFDFTGSALMPWVEVALAPPGTDRKTQVDAAIKALRDAHPGQDPLAGFDGVLLFTLPGGSTVNKVFSGWDGGSGNLDDGRPFSTIPVVPSTSVFMCHELGHTLGFDHSFGIDNNGTDWDPGDANIILGPEYGSPCDIMSAETFGTRWLGTGPFWSGNPTFIGDDIPNWPSTTARARGPHLSRANLHKWYPDAFGPGRIIEHPFPSPGVTGGARLRPPGAKAGATLLVLHPPGEPASGVGRVYVEYRPARDWDVGLKQGGTDLAQAGLVIHTLETASPGNERVWYRGSVPMNGVDLDFQLPGSSLTITLANFQNDESGCWADVAYALGSSRSVSIEAHKPIETPLGQIGESTGRTPCGDVTRKIIWSTSTLTYFSVSTLGFGGGALPATPPKIVWKVGGKPVSGASGTVKIAFGGDFFTLEYTIDAVTSALGLTSQGGEKFSTSVEAVASEAGGGASATAQAKFEAQGSYESYTPKSVAVMAQCIDKLSKYVASDQGHIPRPGPPVERPDAAAVRRFADLIRTEGVVLHPREQIKLDLLTRLNR